jgi:hypothetical protein
MQSTRFLILSTSLLASALGAQVRRGEAIVSNFTNAAPMEGLLVANRSGVATPVTGLAATGQHNLNSVAIDPMNDRIWMGSITVAPTTIGLRTILINPAYAYVAGSITTVTSAFSHGPGGSLAGIDFDLDGNPIVSGGAAPPGTGGLFRVNRTTAAVTNLLSPFPLPAGTVNCVDVDPRTGDIYFALTSAGAPVYRMTGAPGYTVAPVLVGNVSPPSTSPTISGLAFTPAAGPNPATLFWTTFGTAATCFGSIPAAGGAAVAIPGVTNVWNPPNWVEYDNLVGDMWVVSGGIDPDSLWTTTRTGVNPLVCLIPPGGVNGSPSCVDVNDSAVGELRIAPQFVPLAPAPITLEVTACWQPGDFGVIVITSPFVAVLGTGTIGVGGKLPISLPGVVVAAGSPGAITFMAAAIDLSTFTVRGVSAPTRWPRN